MDHLRAPAIVPHPAVCRPVDGDKRLRPAITDRTVLAAGPRPAGHTPGESAPNVRGRDRGRRPRSRHPARRASGLLGPDGTGGRTAARVPRATAPGGSGAAAPGAGPATGNRTRRPRTGNA
ncbi:hypothetical protein SGPA1_20362 [Streptomyces misionensis JCM 4497]